MRTKTFVLILLFLVLSFALTACGNKSLASTDAPGLTVHNNVAYLAGGGYVYAIDVTNGNELTYKNADGETTPKRFLLEGKDTFYGEPAFTEEGQMIIGSANINNRKHPIYSADAETFKVDGNWPQDEVSEDTWMAGALIIGNTIYAPNSDGTLYAFGLDGTVNDKFTAEQAFWSAPITDGERIYLSSMDHNLYALNPANLETAIWKTDMTASIIGSPVFADGKLFVGNIAGDVFAVESATGKILWQTNLGGIISDHLAYADGKVFVGTTLRGVGQIFAIDAENGSQLWSKDAIEGEAFGGVVGAPLATETAVVFVTETGYVLTYDFDGNLLWKNRLLDAKDNAIKIYSAPVAVGDMILVAPFGNSSKMLVAYDSATGDTIWVFAPKQ